MVVAALNLALFRGIMKILTIPVLAALLVLLDLALIRLLNWRQSFRPFEYGFVVAGFMAAMVTLPFNQDPHILEWILELNRDLTGDTRTFRFNNTASFIYMERAVLGFLILVIALSGGLLAGWGSRWLGRRRARIDRTASLEA